MIFELLQQNDAESFINFVKIIFLDPKRAKLNQKSEYGHVQHVPKAPSEGEALQKNNPFFILVSKSIFAVHKLLLTP